MIKDIVIILLTFVCSYFFIMGLVYGLFRLLFLEENENEVASKTVEIKPAKRTHHRKNKQYIFKHALNTQL